MRGGGKCLEIWVGSDGFGFGFEFTTKLYGLLNKASLMLLIKRRKKALHRLLGLLQGGSKHHL